MRLFAAGVLVLAVASVAEAQLRSMPPPVVPHPPIVPPTMPRLDGNLNGSLPISPAPRLHESFSNTARPSLQPHITPQQSPMSGGNTPAVNPPVQVIPPTPPRQQPPDADGDAQEGGRSNRGWWWIWLVAAAVAIVVLSRRATDTR